MTFRTICLTFRCETESNHSSGPDFDSSRPMRKKVISFSHTRPRPLVINLFVFHFKQLQSPLPLVWKCDINLSNIVNMSFWVKFTAVVLLRDTSILWCHARERVRESIQPQHSDAINLICPQQKQVIHIRNLYEAMFIIPLSLTCLKWHNTRIKMYSHGFISKSKVVIDLFPFYLLQTTNYVYRYFRQC